MEKYSDCMDLAELFEAMDRDINAVDESGLQDLRDFEWPHVPTFGGEDPRRTCDCRDFLVWSWDLESVLIETDAGLAVMSREALA